MGGETDPLMEDKDDPATFEEREAGESEVVVQGEETAIGFFGALRIPGVVEFSLCLFFAKLVSYTFLYWLPNYIHEKDHVDAEKAAVLSTIFDLGGIVGGVVAGLVSASSQRPATTCLVMLVAAVPTMYSYQKLVNDWCPITAVDGAPVHNSCYTANILFTGTLVNGPYALITTAVSAELGQHPSLRGSSKALATVTAIIDGTGSIGAAIGPFLAGALSARSWDLVFDMLMAADAMAFLFLLRLVTHEVTRSSFYRRFRDRMGRRQTEDYDYQSINTS